MSSRKVEAVTQQHSSSPTSRGNEILVVYCFADDLDTCAATETGFELILNESTAEPESETEKLELLTVKQQPKTNHMRQFTPTSKNDKTTSASVSPTRTQPLTPISTSSSRQRSPTSVNDFEAHASQQRKDQNESGSPQTRTLALQKLVCSKHTGNSNEISVENDNTTSEMDNSTSYHRRLPVLRKLICQKYKRNPSEDEVDQAQMISDLHRRISPKQRYQSNQDRTTPRALNSSKNTFSSVEQDQEEPIKWKTDQDDPFENTLHDTRNITPRIVQRLEQTELQRHTAQQETLPEVQHLFASLQVEEQAQRSRERRSRAYSIASTRQFHSPINSDIRGEPSSSVRYQAATTTPRAVWTNEVSSSQMNFLGGSAYQRRIKRFQKEHGTPASAEFVFGSGQGDDESSFVEWVEQIENEKVNGTSHPSSQRVGLHFSNVPTPSTITIPRYKAMNKSLNTTAETSTYSSIGYGDDHHTHDTASHLSDKEVHLLPSGTTTLRQASFDGSTAPLSLGSIDSHHFGRSAFVDATPGAIIAAARAGDFDDDDDMWSGNITVKDEEFALAGVYSTSQLPF
jgi:hypothetical protein